MTTLSWSRVHHGTAATQPRGAAALRWALVGALLLIAAMLRFGGLDRESRHGDEYHQTMAYGMAPQYVALWARTAGQPPLDSLIGWAVAKVNPSLWAMRAPAACFGVASVGLCFAVVRRASHSWFAGFVAAGVVALSPLHWRMSQTARPYTIFIAALLLAMWALLAAVERPDRRRLAAYAIAAYMMTLTNGLGPLVALAATGIAVCVVLGTLGRPATGSGEDAIRGPDMPAQRPASPTQLPGMPTQAWAWHPLGSLWQKGTGSERLRIPDAENDAPQGACPLLPRTVRAERAGLWRVGWVTLAVGLAALPMLVFLLRGAGEWTVIGRNGAGNGAAVGVWPAVERLGVNAAVWWKARVAMFGPAAALVLIAALAGVMVSLRRWRTLPASVRCAGLAGWLMGPVALLAFSATVAESPIRDRYGLFLVPIVAAFAGVGADALGRRLPRRWAAYPAMPAAMVSAAAVVLASPAAGLRAEIGKYHNPDWRGCAAFLAETISPEDVVMVLADRPLGKTQPPFWGKIEWPAARRPLGEAMWTLATSPPHGQRLGKQTGRCYVVVLHEAGEQAGGGDAPGLTAAPPGMVLHRFRHLELLRHEEPANDTLTEVVAFCDELSRLPWAHPEVRAIPLALKARVLAERGDRRHAQEAYVAALAHVPTERRAWFEKMTAMIASAAPDDD